MKYSKLLLGLVLTIVLHFAIFKSGLIEYFDFKIYDFIGNTSFEKNEDKKTSVVLVDIDEKSLKHLGQWPWSRVILAQMIHTINQYKPTAIGIDIIFPEYDKTSPKELIEFYAKYLSTNVTMGGLDDSLLDNDKLFAAELSKAKTILPVYMNNGTGDKPKCVFPIKNNVLVSNFSFDIEANSMLCNISELQEKAATVGFINFEVEKDGIFRKLPLFMQFEATLVPSFALANLMSIDKLSVQNNVVSILNHDFKMDDKANVLLKYYDNSWYKTISAIDLLSGNIDKSVLSGKFVLIGTSAVGLHDTHMTSSGKILPGVFTHITLMDNILHDELRYQPEFIRMVNFMLSLLFSVVSMFFLVKKNYIKFISIFLFSVFLSIFLGYFLLSQNIYISLGYFLFPFVSQFILVNIFSVFIYYRDEQKFYMELFNAHSSTIDSMALVVEIRDTETGAHITRTKEYIKYLSDYLYDNGIYKDILTLKFRKLLYIANPLHDIGKVGIPDYILKKPGKLTAQEYEIMKGHALIGKKIMDNAIKANTHNDFLLLARNIAYCHHEKWDGSGYPNALSGEAIPLEARIMALADVYDALISRRCYKEAFDYSYAEDIIISARGTHFDPLLVDAFIVVREEFKDIAERIKN